MSPTLSAQAGLGELDLLGHVFASVYLEYEETDRMQIEFHLTMGHVFASVYLEYENTDRMQIEFHLTISQQCY